MVSPKSLEVVVVESAAMAVLQAVACERGLSFLLGQRGLSFLLGGIDLSSLLSLR